MNKSDDDFFVQSAKLSLKFANDPMRLADVPFSGMSYKFYNDDTEQRTKYTDDNMMKITHIPENELTPDVIALRNKVIEKKKKFYYSVV